LRTQLPSGAVALDLRRGSGRKCRGLPDDRNADISPDALTNSEIPAGERRRTNLQSRTRPRRLDKTAREGFPSYFPFLRLDHSRTPTWIVSATLSAEIPFRGEGKGSLALKGSGHRVRVHSLAVHRSLPGLIPTGA